MSRDIERLIASAYSDLEPPVAVEEAVREGLSAERVRPARGRGAALLAVVLCVALWVAWGRLPHARGVGPGGLAGEGESAPQLPVVTRPPSGVVAQGADWIRVRIDRDGRVFVPRPPEKETWTEVSLVQLAAHLKRAASDFHDRESAEGRPGYDEGAKGVGLSRLRVDLFADRAARWAAVTAVLAACAQQRMPRIAFVVRDSDGEEFRLDASLPADLGMERAPEVRVSVLVRAGDPVRYRFGEQESEELASVSRYLARARKAAESAKARLRGEIRTASGVAFHDVAKLLAEFRQAGYAQVDFFGEVVPEKDAAEEGEGRSRR